MWKQVILFVLLLSSGLSVAAQQGDRQRSGKENQGLIRQAREAYLRENLPLTEAEAKVFFPIFWSYDERMRKQRRATLGHAKRRNQGDKEKTELTEAEALKKLMDLRRERQALLDLQTEAEEDFLKIIPAAKVVRLAAVEKAFRERLWERMRNRRERLRGGSKKQ